MKVERKPLQDLPCGVFEYMESLSWFPGGDSGCWVGKEEEGLDPLEQRYESEGFMPPEMNNTFGSHLSDV